jgi:hypothetical protein
MEHDHLIAMLNRLKLSREAVPRRARPGGGLGP